MKNIFMAAIRKGGYDLNMMLHRIDEYHITGKLTDTERDTLIAAARGEASPNFDVTAEIQYLWVEIRKLQTQIDNLKGENVEGNDQTGEIGIPEYKQPTGAHDAYFNGDRVIYNGVTYTCIAPDEVACVWSPDVMPIYWAC